MVKKEEEGKSLRSIKGIVIDVDYINVEGSAYIRLVFKAEDGKVYDIYDKDFLPYFYLVPYNELDESSIKDVNFLDNGKRIGPVRIEKTTKKLIGKKIKVYKIYVKSPGYVPKLSAMLSSKGTPYENDIVFAKRYIIDKDIVPFTKYIVEVDEEGPYRILKRIKLADNKEDNTSGWSSLNSLCFDIETYNARGESRPDVDPILMISYSYAKGNKEKGRGVITYKEVNNEFVELARDEKDMIEKFTKKLDELNIDVISGYASSNFDIKYMLERASVLKIDLKLGRFKERTRLERHGLYNKVKIAGRIHIDMYHVAKFISRVGAQENILKLDSFRLKDVYEAVAKNKKVMVEKGNIYQMWDEGGEKLEELVRYNLNDSDALRVVYDTFAPIIFELSKITGNSVSDVAVSTTSQLDEFMLMKYTHKANGLILNRPKEREIIERIRNPIEGAYVKTPEPGIYDNIAVFDFRGLYPSIIISHNIDAAAICTSCTNYYESPTGVRFNKDGKYIAPTILKLLIDQRKEIKKLYKKNPDNIILGSRSQALKILANSFYGYLDYARARWYSRECAASVTAFGRQYIKNTIEKVEDEGFKVIYSDTDSILLLLGNKKKEDVLNLLERINKALPGNMELELEDFYKRGVFVGRKTEKKRVGAKKKYALISESGRIKIKGFELVRRDWSRIAQSTQRKVLEVILNEGSAEKAAEIVRKVIKNLKEGKVPLEELIIRTRLRKGIYSYDLKSPEISAARKAVEQGFKKKEDLEHNIIGYIITKKGKSISDKAQLYGIAKDYDANYYIENQVLPATMRILKELNFGSDELKNTGKQKRL